MMFAEPSLEPLMHRIAMGVCLTAELKGHLNGARVELVRFLKEQAMPPASPFANEEEWVSGVNSALAA
ncbi:MAG: hypothetical protein UT33_C0011G0193 [Candidatus Peregrinibacteria bacterium GW2011_GWC2_39_14]|nr:MAG: hypothetical protein UT33_C0011G0193 [Candidatus Peregrinibacteria bacterium GW2011_GWC2_39_14]